MASMVHFWYKLSRAKETANSFFQLSKKNKFVADDGLGEEQYFA